MQNARIMYHYIDKNTKCINVEKPPKFQDGSLGKSIVICKSLKTVESGGKELSNRFEIAAKNKNGF